MNRISHFFIPPTNDPSTNDPPTNDDEVKALLEIVHVLEAKVEFFKKLLVVFIFGFFIGMIIAIFTVIKSRVATPPVLRMGIFT